MNKCIFTGHLGRDPEVRNTQDGTRIVNFSLAVSEKWKTRDGEQKERVEWIPVTIWNERIGEIAERYLRKGSKCLVEGAWQSRKWTDKDGNERTTTELVLQKFRGELELLGDGNGRSESHVETRSHHATPARSAAPAPEFDDSDIPF